MSRNIELSMAIAPYDRHRPLDDGRVTIDGVDTTVLTYPSPERHRRMLKHTEFDICEMSSASYLATVERDYPFTAIPVFPHRTFRHSYFFVNANAGIESPTDLEGKRVGIRRWQNSAGLWMRGIAQDYYDVDITDIEWYIDDEDEVPIEIPSQYSAQRIDDDDNINDMLVRGDLDATMYPRPPSAFKEGSDEIERLFPDFKAEELRYYHDTGVFPIMHFVVIHDDVVDEHPWVPMNVKKAFEQSKQIALEELQKVTHISLVWAQSLLDEQKEEMGLDLWPPGVEPNRTELERAISYAHRDGLLSAKIDPEELFIESSLEDLPRYV